MAQSASADKRAREEAAAWFAQMNRRSVPLQSLEAFRAWREDPRNRAAYQAVDFTWRGAEAVKDDPAIQDALAAAFSRPGRSRSARWAWPAGLATAGLAVAAIFAITTLSAGSTYATRVGEQRLVRLDDGTTMRLDTDTKVAVAFRGRERRVRLTQGQAFFDVAHDPARPFIVDAGSMRVRAVGTRFDVRRDGAEAKVTLVEGIVQVRSLGGGDPDAWTLKPGEQVRLGRTSARVTADVAAATSWTSGRVIFRGIPLAQAIDEINRYSPHKIRLEAQAVAAVPVTGSFETGDVDAFVSAVTDLHGLRATRQIDGTIILGANLTPDV
jgi:transmembrane sensor